MFTLPRLATRGFGRAAFRSAFSSSTAPSAARTLDKTTVQTGDVLSGAAAQSDKKPKNLMVAAAFESLATNEENASAASAKPDPIDELILNAKTVAGLLSVTEGSTSVNRKHALKIVSILAEWSSINRVKLSDFENDARFIKLCRLLGRAVPKVANGNGNNKKITGFRTDDLNTVIGVAGDDEAAKLIASISIPQMIKVMSTLAHKKRRSTPLLRSLAYNISSNSEQLDLKQCADLLYAMAVLNFPDSVLISRVSIDIQNGLMQNNDKSAAVGSILTSLGLLKFRDADVLESLADWVLQHYEICRPQDISSLFLTLATLNYPTTKAEQLRTKLVSSLVAEDFTKLSDWLNHVWALVVLNFADAHQFDSVLKKDFVEQLVAERTTDLSPTMKMKLLNIDSATQLLPDYTGSRLPSDSSVFDVPLVHSKNKQILVSGLLDALKSLFADDAYVRTNFDTKMGFVIDAECVLDGKKKPLAVEKDHKDATRLALMVLDFHDMSQGVHQQANGVTALAHKLLEHRGYTILTVPYNEFSTSDKLLKRVQYLESKLKRITGPTKSGSSQL